MSLISRKARLWLLLLLTAAVAAACFFLPRIPQPLSYHLFADRRSFLGIPNFGDVVSNLPFAAIGIWGLVFLRQCKSNPATGHFLEEREQWPYIAVFAGLLLTAFGSSWYHLNPNNGTLVWDRLPMTITFMGLVAAVIMERISLALGLRLLPILVLLGIASVLQWNWSEMHGMGDLRFYAAVQAYSTLVVLLALLFPPRYTQGRYLGFVVCFYALAKVLELFDKPIFATLRVVSGHTLKHLAAAAAGYSILRMLQLRQPVQEPRLVPQPK
ncbi:MAG TPA: hypothetical protein VKB38_12075 [Terracidiphilus sp.]|nr:hypothetical protein [Terracidiphilus sp.]